jgi:glycosyltransferase involved in cell wall biosynthesis
MTALDVSNPAAVMARDRAVKPASVVLVLPTYLPESFGGAEQQARKLGLALARLGARVSLLAPRLRATTPHRGRDASISLWRFKVRKPPNLGGRYIGSLIAWSVKLFWWLARHQDQYDVIHIMHGRLHAVPAVIAGALLRKPTLVKIGRGGTTHFDLNVVSRKKVLGKWYARRIVNNANAYVANSSEIADDLQRWGVPASRIHRIPNGVEIPPYAESCESDELRFIYVGRLDPEKNLDLMIRGFALLDDVRAKLTIVGDGSCRAALRTLVKDLRVGDRVRLTEPVSDVGAVLEQAHVYVSTSLSEGMSNALLEAMSFGLAPVVSLVSGVTDLVEDGRSGLLFPPGDLDAFVRKLREACSLSPARRRAIGLTGREFVARYFSIDQVAKRHLALYEHLLGTCDS